MLALQSHFITNPSHSLLYLYPQSSLPEREIALASSQEITIKKTEKFISILQKKFSVIEIGPLSKVIDLIRTGHHPAIKQALTKKKGYIQRLFSKESWTEWTDNRTALGKVVSTFSDYLENGKLHQLLNREIVEKANAKAVRLLKDKDFNLEDKSHDLYQTISNGLFLIDQQFSSLFPCLQGAFAESLPQGVVITIEQTVHKENKSEEKKPFYTEEEKNSYKDLFDSFAPTPLHENKCSSKKDFDLLKNRLFNPWVKVPLNQTFQNIRKSLQLINCREQFVHFISQIKQKIKENDSEIALSKEVLELFYGSPFKDIYFQYAELVLLHFDRFLGKDILSLLLDALEHFVSIDIDMQRDILIQWIEENHKITQDVEIKRRLEKLLQFFRAKSSHISTGRLIFLFFSLDISFFIILTLKDYIANHKQREQPTREKGMILRNGKVLFKSVGKAR